MKRTILIFIFSFTFCHLAISQVFTDSNLPIVVINTDGGVYIPDSPRVLASMKIIYRGPGERNYMTDQNNTLYLNYNGRISIEIRGSSSQSLPKKPYGLTTLEDDNVTDFNVSLLGMPKENDWILNCLNFEPSCIRDYLSYNLSRQIGEYAPRTVYCEVVLNGEYNGLYLLEEKIKPDKNRVNIERITPADNVLPGLSGGYITKADKTNGDPISWTMYAYNGQPVDYINDWPNTENATTVQTNYIKGQFDNLATASHLKQTSISTGYPSMIDIPSFIDYMLLCELASNPDSYQYSTYFHKDRNGKLRAGPIWDFNLSYGNDLFIWGFDRSKTYVWQFNSDDGNNGSKFWRDLFSISSYKCYMSKRWNSLIADGQPFNLTVMSNFIDQTVAAISEAVVREQAKWGTIGDHAGEIAGIKTFLDARIAWITSNIGSYSGCDDVSVPPLVISKIMFSPGNFVKNIDANDLEFIQISNNGGQVVDLTGIYFSGTGLVYNFPVSSTLKEYGSLYLASNSTVFEKVYGIIPFGEYTRNLSDLRQKLELSDAHGNVIDSLTYSDSYPWPYADGNGYYLNLKDLAYDNAIAQNWEAYSSSVTSVDGTEFDGQIQLSPNPVHTILTVESKSEIETIQILDMLGNTVLYEEVDYENAEVDMTQFKEGIYIFRMQTSSGIITRKVVKY